MLGCRHFFSLISWDIEIKNNNNNLKKPRKIMALWLGRGWLTIRQPRQSAQGLWGKRGSQKQKMTNRGCKGKKVSMSEKRPGHMKSKSAFGVREPCGWETLLHLIFLSYLIILIFYRSRANPTNEFCLKNTIDWSWIPWRYIISILLKVASKLK